MEQITNLLTSVVFWSTSIAVVVVVVGIKHTINNIIKADKEIEEKRKQQAQNLAQEQEQAEQQVGTQKISQE